MKYDLDEIRRRVNDRRKGFLIRVCFLALLFIAAVLAMLLFPDITVNFVSVVVIVFIIFGALRLFEKYEPLVLFSKEIRGVNVKEHEYVCNQRKGFTILHRGVFARAGLQRVSTARIKASTKAIVYLKLEDGNIAVIDGLTNAHTDVYDDGDELLRISGTKYPIIINRATKKQPCPVCGTVNRIQDESCFNCNLKIYTE